MNDVQTLHPDRLAEWLSIPTDELESRSSIPLTIVRSAKDVHEHMAQEMFEEALDARNRGEQLAIIVPVGPKGHYGLLAEKINAASLNLDHVTYFGMDDWLDWECRPLPSEHPFSLSGFFRREYLERIEPGLRPPPENIIFPSPFDLERPSAEILTRGPIATTYGGFGFQGHVAFNEPPDMRWSSVTLEQFRNSKTRIVPLALDTLIAHAQRSLGGHVGGVPPMAVTLGMKDLLSARRIRLYTDSGSWKHTILRILLFAEPTVAYPVTLVHDHPDVRVVVDRASAAPVAVP